jgi:hypothetical protein
MDHALLNACIAKVRARKRVTVARSGIRVDPHGTADEVSR